MKKLIYLIVFAGLISPAMAQQELQVSQYMFNGLLLNPAYAGTHPYFGISGLHRSQWVSFDNAPTSQVFSIDGPLGDKGLGVGLLIHNDKLGVTSELDASANLSYQLPLGTGALSFGLKLGVSSYSADLTDVVVWDNGDPVYAQNLSGELATKFGFGVYYYTDLLYIGASVPNIYSLDDNIIQSQDVVDNYFTQHYYFNAGYVIESSPTFAIKPSILVKLEPSAPVEVDLNCNFLFFNKIWLGAGYRTGDAVIGMLEYNVNPQLRAGYAYDFTLTDIADYSSGSHEIMIAYDFGKAVSIKTRSPRYF